MSRQQRSGTESTRLSSDTGNPAKGSIDSHLLSGKFLEEGLFNEAKTNPNTTTVAGGDPAGKPVSREMDPTVNPYAAALSQPGKSKRAWDAGFIGSFLHAKAGDPVRFELTDGVIAQGTVKMIQSDGTVVSHVSGDLTAPEKGKFFLLTPPAGGKAGAAVGVVEFPASKTAYRIEPTGPDGAPELWKRRLDEVVCGAMEEADPELLAEQLSQAESGKTAELVPLRPDQVPEDVPAYNDGIVSLQSYPGSPAVLLLDFAGGYTSSWGGVTYARAPMDNGQVRDVWKRIAEDFMPFNVNVTTDIKVFQAAPAASRQRCCFTPSHGGGGVAYIGSWNWGNDTVAWSGYWIGKSAAEVGSHEVGHTMGLGHMGQNGGGEYYGGQGGGTTGWAPIMGVGYYQALTTWNKGEYQNANNTTNELAQITEGNNNVDYRNDDTGGALANSRYLEVYTDNTVFAQGVIERTADTDAFQFTTTGGAVTLTVNPVAPGDWANLATKATLANEAGGIILTSNPQDHVSSTITTTLAAGTYTFSVTGAGKNDPVTNGFSDYGSLGYYSISGSVPGGRQSTRLTVAERAPNSTVVGTVSAINPNSSPLVYTITGGNTGTTFSVSNTGVVTVANNTLLDYYALAADPARYAAEFEVFMDITNVNNPALTETNRRVVIAVQQLYAAEPTALTATLDSSLRINLSWIGSYGATGYSVKRSTTPGGPYTSVATVTGTSYTDGGLTHGVTYYYVVTAVNSNGESYPSTEAHTAALSVAGGFESPVLGNGVFKYNPNGGGGWTFSGASPSGSGIVANGSAFSNPNAPEGIQAAFVQGTGTMTQTFAGFTPGTTYQIRYAAAQRPGYSQTWDVKLDNTVIQSNPAGSTRYAIYTTTFTATATTHTVSFVGTDLAGNADTVFIDNVQVTIATPTIQNASFENPGVNGFQYNPSGGSWTFNGASPNGSGIVANGGAFGNAASPLGTQAGFVQSYATISQTLSGFIVGRTYTLAYSAAQRPGWSQTWNVKLDNTIIQSNAAGGTAYATYVVNFTATATTHTLSFVGTDLAGNYDTVFIDNVSLVCPLQTVAAAVALASPADDAVFATHAPVNLTAAVSPGGNLIQGVQFYIDNTLIGQIDNAPYVCAWGNSSVGSHTTFARVLFNNGSFAESTSINLTVLNANLNLGFETPGLGGGQIQYNPSGGSWEFSSYPNGSGIVSNGSGFNNPTAPQGTQVAFVQSHGSVSQALSGFVPGTSYTINYSASQRPGYSQTWDVKIDNTVIQSNTAGGNAFVPCTATFTATAASHTLSFVGTDIAGNQDAVFLDNISFNPPLVANQSPILVANTSPATAADVVGSEVTFLAAFSSPLPTTYQWQKIVNGRVTDVAGATTPTLTLSNLQLGDTGPYRLQASNAAGISVSSVSVLTVSSLPAAVNNVITGYAAQTGLGSAVPEFSPTWEVAPGSLISSKSPASVGSGNFSQSTSVLTNGSAGRSILNQDANATQVTCGNDAARGQSVTYQLGASSGGYNLSSIVVHGGWSNAGRDQQAYTVYYSTVSDPATFIQLAVVNYEPANPASVQSATRSTLRSATSAPLASNVASLKFDFSAPASEDGWVGYTEIAVYGAPLEPAVTMQTSPATAVDVVGSQMTFTASIVGAAPLSYQWQKVVGGVPSNIAGATGPTLNLTNLQLGDTAGYQLKATNSSGTATSTPGTLTVTSVPAAVNNLITSMAAQTGLGGNTTFLPSWKLIADNSLIDGLAPSASSGNFDLMGTGRTTAALTTVRSLAISPSTGGDNTFNYLSGGNGGGAGTSVVYTLPASATGHTLTKILVHAGWSDAGRDQQAYTVSYSNVSTPTTFVSLGAVNYNPVNPAGVASTTRATLTPANGVLATNVAAVKFDFTTPGSENGWVGYAQLAVYGAPTLTTPTALAATTGNAQATLTWTGVAGATSYNVKRSTVSGGSYTTVGNVPTPGFMDTGLTNGTPYFYVVTALNAAGETGPSSQASVTPVSAGYEGWLAGYPSITGPDRASDADPDHDGLPNGIEFLTGTSPANGTDSAPVTTTVDGSGNLVLHFKRVDAAKDYIVAVESSADLQTPITSLIVTNSAISGPPLTVVENGTSADDITVVIPANGDPAKFARVRITIPTSP
ncbi:MAG: Ig-like domain-containing protein [Verrucomicrobiota bacterium]